MSETISLFRKSNFLFFSLTGHVLVTVQHYLRPEGWMPTHLYRDMAPVRIENMKVIVVNVRSRVLLLYIANLARAGHLYIPHHRW
jgi:hypothetical protein